MMKRPAITRIAALVLCSVVIATCSMPAHAQVGKAAPGADQPRTLTLAYYYPWYIRGDWSRHGYVGTPKLGTYGTDEPAVVEQHIRWARRGGIDALVVSWWGPEDLTFKHINQGLFKADNLDEIRFAIIYESLGRLDAVDGKADSVIDFAQPAVVKRFIADLKLLKQTCFSHPSYLTLGDRPVVVLYVTRTFRNFKRTHIAQAEQAIDLDLYLVADEPFFGRQKDPKTALNGIDKSGTPLFDAYTTYNLFENARVQNGETAWEYIQREAMPIFKQWSRTTVFCPNVMPSYHDFRGNKKLRGDLAGFKAQLEAVQRLPRYDDAPDDPRLIFVTSFNEWWEGTTIEPAEEYGTTYLDVLRTTIAPGSESR